jgi:hypothetical protein
MLQNLIEVDTVVGIELQESSEQVKSFWATCWVELLKRLP